MPCPRSTTVRSAGGEAELLLLLLVLCIGARVAGLSLGVCEEEQVLRLLRVEAGVDGGGARVRDRAGRQPRVHVGVERRVLLLLLVGQRALLLAQAVEHG